jgi:hypothetical protein
VSDQSQEPWVENLEWPTPIEIKTGDAEAETKKALYQAKLELVKEKYKASLDEAKAKEAERVEKDKANYANDHAQTQAINSAYLEVAKGQIDRSLQRAEFIQKVASAIGAAYAAVVGLSFAVKDGVPLPARGITPTIFLGLSIFLAAVYVSYFTMPTPSKPPDSDGSLVGNQRSRRIGFILWVRKPTLVRRRFLQASVVSLGLGVLFLPVAYLSIDCVVMWGFGIVGVIAVAIIPYIIGRIIHDTDLPEPSEPPQSSLPATKV